MTLTQLPVVIVRSLWKTIFGLSFIFSLIVFYPFFYLAFLNKKDITNGFRFTKAWGNWLFFSAGIWISVKREIEDDAHPKPCIYCSNHTSYLDIIYNYIIIPNVFVALAKQQLEKIPLFKILIQKINISVDRKSPVSSHKAFVKAGQYLDQKISVFLFPEGSISKKAPQMQAFKNGAFKLAIEKQVPIVPITFVNNWKLLQNGSFLYGLGRPGIAKAVIHQPIETTGMTIDDLPLLKEQVMSTIEQELQRHACNKAYKNSVPENVELLKKSFN